MSRVAVLVVLDAELARANLCARSTASAFQHSLQDEAGKARQRQTAANAQSRLELMTEARGAVANLIEAAEGFRAVTSGDDGGNAGMAACALLDKAIERVHGGAA